MDLSSVWCVLAIWWTGPNVFALLWLHPARFHPMVLLCGHVGRRMAHSTMALALCVVCASPSGEAAIMGVPLPHLVLPLPGCLSRRTPTKAKRGDARGHKPALAQNPLLKHPFCFFRWTGRRPGVSSPDGGLAPLCLRCCGYIPVGCRSIALLCGHVGR